MIFKEVFEKVDIDSIIAYLNRNYPQEKDLEPGYRDMYDKLLAMEPDKDADLILYVSLIYSIFEDEEPYLDVSGYSLEEDMSYALEFRAWEQWLGMQVAQNSLEEYGRLCFVAECMREMSFISFDEGEISETLTELEESAEKIKSGEAKLIPAEEVFDELREEFGDAFFPKKMTPEEEKVETECLKKISEKNEKLIHRMLGLD